MKFLHAMVRVCDLEQSLDFYINKFGLIETDIEQIVIDNFDLTVAQ